MEINTTFVISIIIKAIKKMWELPLQFLVDGEGSPIALEVTSAKGDERLQVEPLLESVSEQIKVMMQMH
ncbi:hypothetical protein [Candidatus Neptunichlamydia sp. REUL1]|uniref:hypothetical protein n=1 Tax=Candidatus Neptunichlamydia sp. REUL1 TaxID=3064277 RepID=UPI002931E56A|nr:hypothetical protein [Candidatus Neptunochlamydia sp. REUL1]